MINIAYFSYTIIIPTGFPRYLIAGNLIIGLFLIFFPRFFLRALFLLENQKKTDGKNCLIIGAGTATDSLLREYNRNSKMDFRVVGLVDDNPKKKNTIMHNHSAFFVFICTIVVYFRNNPQLSYFITSIFMLYIKK